MTEVRAKLREAEMATTGELRVITRGTWRLKLCYFMLRVAMTIMEIVNRARFRKDERPGTVILDLIIDGRPRIKLERTTKKPPSLGSMPA
jgi:hypothetical protein